MMTSFTQNESKYIKPTRENKIFYAVSVFFFFNMFVMPQYFGIPFPFFDLTILRIGLLMVLFMILANVRRAHEFWDIVKNSKFTVALIPYIIVLGYTMVLRADINAFLNPFIEILILYLMIYIIREALGIEKTIKIILFFCYILLILGIEEYFTQETPFAYLETLDGIYTGGFVRSGSYRVMSSFSHSLGYGLFLTLFFPFAAYDIKNQKINIGARPGLELLFLINVFFTGSRSTQGLFFLELALLFVFLDKESKKKFLFGMLIFVSVSAVLLTALQKTSFGNYILLQITTLVDSTFGTSFSVKFGGNIQALNSSSNYREQLVNIFKIKWLNPLLGIGRKRGFSAVINGAFIRSIDNFYIAEYVRYAYPGLCFYIVFLLYWAIRVIKNIISEKNNDLVKVISVSVGCYLLCLKWVDSLQTLKYLYLVFAIFYCYAENVNKMKESQSDTEEGYIKKRKF